MPSFTETFGGNTINPTSVSYAGYTITANLALQWPFQALDSANVLADKISVSASAGLVVTFPDATIASVGQDALVNNTGSNTFTIKDYLGVTLATVASGEAWYLYLTSNATTGGTWKVFQFGVGTSSANAATLAGAGIVAAATQLNQNLTTTSSAISYVPVSGDRATVLRNTGGAVVYSPTSAVTLGNGWFVYVINNGTGDLVWTPSGGQLIDGAATKTLSPSESCIFFSDAANFWSLGFGRSLNTTVTSVSISIAGSGETALTTNQVRAQVQNFTGALTGNSTVVYGTTVGVWFVYNNTSGNYTVTYKVNAGDTGVAVAQGDHAAIRSNGTNMELATAAASPWVFISRQVANNSSADLSFTGLGTAYQDYLLLFDSLTPSDAALAPIVQLGEGVTPTWQTSGYYAIGAQSQYSLTAVSTLGVWASATTGFSLTSGSTMVNTANSMGMNGSMTLFNIPASGTTMTSAEWRTAYYTANTAPAANQGLMWLAMSGYLSADTVAKTGIRIHAPSGTWVSGSATLLGLRKA